MTVDGGNSSRQKYLKFSVSFIGVGDFAGKALPSGKQTPDIIKEEKWKLYLTH
jgi:hypothetical protein